MKTHVILASAALMFLVGCAHGGIKRGHVVMKTSDTTAHVGLATGDVKVGDHVALYHNECKGGGGGRKGEALGPRVCKKVATGHGVVTELFDADYAQVEFPSGTSFTEGDTIEKHDH